MGYTAIELCTAHIGVEYSASCLLALMFQHYKWLSVASGRSIENRQKQIERAHARATTALQRFHTEQQEWISETMASGDGT